MRLPRVQLIDSRATFSVRCCRGLSASEHPSLSGSPHLLLSVVVVAYEIVDSIIVDGPEVVKFSRIRDLKESNRVR